MFSSPDLVFSEATALQNVSSRRTSAKSIETITDLFGLLQWSGAWSIKDKCREPRTASLDGKVEWDLCKKHKCEQHCDLPRRVSTNGLAHRFCSLHECLWNDNGVKCIATVDRNSRFCEDHGCEKGVCFNPRAVVRGKSVAVCWAHKCSNEDCSRFHGLKSWYCEHCRCWDVGCRQQRKPGINALRIPHMFCQNHECKSSGCILAQANCPKHSNDVLQYETVPMFESGSRSQAHSVPIEPDNGISWELITSMPWSQQPT